MAAKKKAKKKPVKSKKNLSPKKGTAKRKLAGKGPVSKKRLKAPRKRARERERVENRVVSASYGNARYGTQSGDLQGISTRHGADSESVNELLEEGNTLEAGVIAGVQEAGDDEPKEVRTHEVLEDDVPSEYLDED